ncbi:MAG: beta-propeller fold lactonase family protein [Blastocatellia bacterium]|jgi:YVTN family beta-propeller protein
MNRRTEPILLLGLALLLFAGCRTGEAPGSGQKEGAGDPSSRPTLPWTSGYRVYVTNESTGDLSVIDGTTWEVIATVPLGKRPRGIHASPDKRTIYVALSGSPPAPPGVDESTLPPADKSADGIGVFDVETNRLVRVLDGGSDPENFAVTADGQTILVSNEDAAGLSYVNIGTGKLEATVEVGEEPEGVTLTPDGTRVYVTDEADAALSVIDVAARKRISTFKVGRRPRNVVFLPDGKRGYVNAENDGTVVLFDAERNVKLEEIRLGEAGKIKPMGLVLSADARQLFVSTGRGRKVFVIDTATNQPTASFEVGVRPWGLALSPDGKTLFTANGPSNTVSVIDLTRQQIAKEVSVTGSPWGVLVIER